MSDTNRIEVHEDALHDGENKESWSANDISLRVIHCLRSCRHQGSEEEGPVLVAETAHQTFEMPRDGHLIRS